MPRRQIHFADQHAVIEFIRDATHFRDHLVHLGLIRGKLRQNSLVGRPAFQVIWIG